jgi:hypothetical protein
LRSWTRTGTSASRPQQEHAAGSQRTEHLPEEIEEKLNNLPYVAECIVVQKEGKIIASFIPTTTRRWPTAQRRAHQRYHGAEPHDPQRYAAALQSVAAIKIYAEEFEKTPKRSSSAIYIIIADRVTE